MPFRMDNPKEDKDMGIKGVDMAAGLESVNNDEEIYDEILQIYYEDGIEMLDVLKQNIQHTDLKLFVTHTHAMKSASKGIGANDVSERFKEMEFAGKDEDMAVIEEKFPSCLGAFEELLGNVKRYLDGDTQDVENTGNALAKTLTAMKEALEEMETDDFEEYLDHLEETETDSGIQAQLHRMREAYEDFDFAQAISIIEECL